MLFFHSVCYSLQEIKVVIGAERSNAHCFCRVNLYLYIAICIVLESIYIQLSPVIQVHLAKTNAFCNKSSLHDSYNVLGRCWFNWMAILKTTVGGAVWIVLHYTDSCFHYFLHHIYINEGSYNISKPVLYTTPLSYSAEPPFSLLIKLRDTNYSCRYKDKILIHMR